MNRMGKNIGMILLMFLCACQGSNSKVSTQTLQSVIDAEKVYYDQQVEWNRTAWPDYSQEVLDRRKQNYSVNGLINWKLYS